MSRGERLSLVRRIQICRSLQRFGVLETAKRRRMGRVVKANDSCSLTVRLGRELDYRDYFIFVGMVGKDRGL
jgi:hypothetical protein